MGRGGRVATASLRRAFSRLDHHQLVLARLVPAAERRRLLVLLRVEAGDALLEGRELDDDEAVESLRAFESLIAPAAGAACASRRSSPTYTQSAGRCERSFAASRSGAGCGLMWRVESPLTTHPAR